MLFFKQMNMLLISRRRGDLALEEPMLPLIVVKLILIVMQIEQDLDFEAEEA